MKRSRQDTAFNVLSTLAAVAVGHTVRKSLEAAWVKHQGDEAPLNPAARDVPWGKAIAYSAAVGAIVGVSRTVGRRLTASAWQLGTGDDAPV